MNELNNRTMELAAFLYCLIYPHNKIAQFQDKKVICFPSLAEFAQKKCITGQMSTRPVKTSFKIA
jgi:hypothetical protein